MDVGTSWGGAYSRWGFDELKNYVMVAKEMLVPGTAQGVPLLDDELNENAEILMTLIRRLIQRGFGNGTDGDGFKIVQSSTDYENNFLITGGNGTLNGAGYIFVDGWMPVILSSLEYTGQSGVGALTTPGINRTDEVYIDIWLDEVGPVGDADIVDPAIGFETSRRIQLNWLVKVAEGAGTPTSYVTNGIRHYTYKIAILNRLPGDHQITTSMIVDTRNTGKALKEREYVHTQSVAADTWTINHSLGTSYVSVSVYDSSGNLIEPGETAIASANQVVLDFSGTTVAGWAVIKGLTAF